MTVELFPVEFPEVEFPTVVMLPDEVWFALEEGLTLIVAFPMVLFERSPLVTLVGGARMVMFELVVFTLMVELPTMGMVAFPMMTGALVPLLVPLFIIMPVLLLVLLEGMLAVPFMVELPAGRVELDPEDELPWLMLGVYEGTVNLVWSTTLHS
jgi:hypothetical protein